MSGIQDWSTEGPYTKLAVFAVGDLLRSAQFVAWATARGMGFKQVVGAWKGKQERAFITDANDIPLLRETWLAGQEAIMFLDPAYRNGRLYGNRRAYLQTLGPVGNPLDETYIGLFRRYMQAGQPDVDGWTFDPTTGQFWIVHTEGEGPEADDYLSVYAPPKRTRAIPLGVPSVGPRGYHDV